MSEFQVILSTVQKAVQRRRWECAWRGLGHGLLWGAVLWIIVLTVYKCVPIPAWSLGAAGIAAAGCMLIGAAIGWFKKQSVQETARWIDRKHQLKERLGTALEISSSNTEWAQLLLRDAAKHASSIQIPQLIRFSVPKTMYWAILALAVGAGLGFVPEYRSKTYVQQQADLAVIKDTGKQLAALTKRNIAQQQPALEQTKKAMEEVNQLGENLARVPLTRSDALRDLSNASEKLSKEIENLAKTPGVKPLEQAARTGMANMPGGKQSEELQRQIEKMQKSLGNEKATPDAINQLKEKMDALQKSMSGMNSKNGAEAQAARSQMANGLQALANEAKSMGLPVDNLEAAIQALQKNQIDQFVKDMEISAKDLNKLKETAQALSQMQKADQLGKDLAEQLKYGQADLACKTLDKMIDTLKKQGLTPQDLQNILKEVTKAVDPASPYGKVADHLKEAVKQMQQAQKSGSETCKSDAAKALADAAKELAKLNQDMKDMQSLLATMESLNMAEQAISSGKGWQCEACGNCNGKGCAQCQGRGWRHGGKNSPNGVGTWASEEEGWTYYNNSPQNPVDNSGIVRPDMDAKGFTDRGDGEVSDALKPSKVKGKINPGGPMPSITLKGVSIKGQSSVEYKEAATSAQSEAQNALNQDQVPRNYQNAVKDYFNDLK